MNQLLAASGHALHPAAHAQAEKTGREMARANVPRMPDAWIADGNIPLPPPAFREARQQRVFESAFIDEAMRLRDELIRGRNAAPRAG